ncbi:MAG: M1 family metallopeptidase [Woeseiaceae bacterium]|nr:M1 family metallopeptidase [Woeseiaceae bacterium]
MSVDGRRLRRWPLIAAVMLLAACAGRGPVTSEGTLDSGRPLSAAMQAYDVLHYTLDHDILVADKAIAGSATIRFRARENLPVLELDFDGVYTIERIVAAGRETAWRRDAEKLWVTLPEALAPNAEGEVTVYYHGRPHEAKRAPWEGGFVWSTTPSSGEPWIATAFQGEGCDIWWPCKDHASGEPLGADLYFTVPAGLTAAANGVLVDTTVRPDGRTRFHWRTSVPTNTYGISLNVGPYVLLEDTYISRNGTEVPIRFWALRENETQARKFFASDFPEVFEFLERTVGPYPWGQEKLGIVETPHYGMEHQTINAYGNKYRRQPYGFDYILHHELAHEWFGNFMTHATVSDLWLHEGLASYLQPLFARETLGDVAFHALMYRAYLGIKSCHPIAPRREMSERELFDDGEDGEGPGGDIYSKGTWLAHSLRYLIGDEAFWRSIRRLVYGTPDPETLEPPLIPRFRTTDDLVRIASEEAGRDLAWFFEVYARQGPLPVLEQREADGGLVLEWTGVGESGFPMPVPVEIGGELRRVEFEGNLAFLPGVEVADVRIDPGMAVLQKLDTVPTCEERRAEDDPPRL